MSTCGAILDAAISTSRVIIDLTLIREKTGPARLLDMVEGRSKAAFKQ